jgi:hypothetical protein
VNIVNLTKNPVLVPTSRGPWLAEPAARPEYPEYNTLYVVDDDVDVLDVLWAPVCITLEKGRVRRARMCAFAF